MSGNDWSDGEWRGVKWSECTERNKLEIEHEVPVDKE